MNKMIMIAACAAALFCTMGCSKENEYEKCLRESMKNMPELVSKPMINSAMEKFRAMNADEQKNGRDNQPELETQIREETAEEVELERQLLGLLLCDLAVLAALLKEPLVVLEEKPVFLCKRPDDRKQLLGLVPVNLAVRQNGPLERLQASDRLPRIHS